MFPFALANTLLADSRRMPCPPWLWIKRSVIFGPGLWPLGGLH